MPQLSLTSLRVRLVALVLLAVLPAAVLTLYANAEERGRAVVQVQETALGVARAAADDQSQLITGAEQLLIALAQLPDVQEGAGACTERMESLLAHYPQYVNLGLVGLDGVITCSGVPLTRVVNVRDRSWFRRTVETRRFAIDNYQIGRVTGKPAINVGIPAEVAFTEPNQVLMRGTRGVEAGGRLAGQAGEVIHRIASEVEGGAQANVQMAAAAQQQTAGVEQIGQAMSSIQQATTQTLASTRQAERAAQDLHTLAQSLQQTVAVYRLA